MADTTREDNVDTTREDNVETTDEQPTTTTKKKERSHKKKRKSRTKKSKRGSKSPRESPSGDGHSARPQRPHFDVPVDPQRENDGYSGHLTEEQQTKLEEFWTLVKDYAKEHEHENPRMPRNDDDCLQFLRARQFDMAKTLEMWTASQKWRFENDIDSIMDKQEHTAGILENTQACFHGRDKLHRPFVYDNMGVTDVKQMLKKKAIPDIEAAVTFHVQRLEYYRRLMAEASAQTGTRVETILLVVDIGSCSLGTHLNSFAREFFGKMAEVGANNYPESAGVTLIINAPWAFPVAWKFIKPFLDPKTVAKIHVFGTSGWKEKLKELVDEEMIPSFLGGKCDCEARGCMKGIDFFQEPYKTMRYEHAASAYATEEEEGDSDDESELLTSETDSRSVTGGD